MPGKSKEGKFWKNNVYGKTGFGIFFGYIEVKENKNKNITGINVCNAEYLWRIKKTRCYTS